MDGGGGEFRVQPFDGCFEFVVEDQVVPVAAVSGAGGEVFTGLDLPGEFAEFVQG